MEVLEAIENAEADLAGTLDELRMAKELVAALEQDAKRIRIEIVGLKSYADRQGLTQRPSPDADVVPINADIDLAPAGGDDITLLSRADAVAAVMRAQPGPNDRSTIHERFIDRGRVDTIDDISLSLSGLKRAGRVEKLGQGLWQLAEDPASAGARS